MSQTPPCPSPQVFTSTSNHEAQIEQYTLGGIAANVKLLLKLIQDHNGGIPKDNDDRRSQRVAGMLSIIDDLQSRIAKVQSSGRGKAELRRCKTELRPQYSQSPTNRKDPELAPEDKESLARQLKSSLAAKRRLEILCSSLGKEKEIMASNLLLKVQEHAEMEEHINDLKAQNEMLIEKVHACAAEHKGKKPVAEEMQGNVALQERSKALSEELLKTLDAYRSLKRRLKNAQEENIEFQETVGEIAMEIQDGVVRIRRLKEKITSRSGVPDVRDDISALENKFLSLHQKIIKQNQKKTESDSS